MRQRAQVALAVAAPVLIMTAVSAGLILFVQHPQIALWMALGVAIVLSLFAALPAAAGVASSIVAHREVHSDSYELIRLTRLTSREITAGFVSGTRLRILPIVAAADSLAVSFFIIPFVALLIDGSVTLLEVNSVFNIGVAFVFVWWMVHQFTRTAVATGVYSATRFKEVSLGGVGVITAAIILSVEIFGPIITYLCLLVTLGSQTTFWLILVPLVYILVPTVGNSILLVSIEKNLERGSMSMEQV